MKKTITNILAVLTIVAIMLTFAACGSSSSAAPESAPTQSGNSAGSSLRAKHESEEEAGVDVSEEEELREEEHAEEDLPTLIQQDISGHYVMDRAEMARYVGGEEDIESNTYALLLNGIAFTMDVADDNTIGIRLGGPDKLYTGSIDMDNMKISITETDEVLDLEYDEATHTFSFVSADVKFILEKVDFSSTFPFEESSRRGFNGIAFFDVPVSWNDAGDTSDPANATIKYTSPDGATMLMSYVYTPDEMAEYGVSDYTLDDWANAIVAPIAEDYADELDTEDYTDSYFCMFECKECNLTFTDGSALRSFVFFDDDGVMHYVSMETLTSSATSHLDDFTQYVRDGFSTVS